MTRVGQILQNATRVGHIRVTPPQSPTLRAITGGVGVSHDPWTTVDRVVSMKASF